MSSSGPAGSNWPTYGGPTASRPEDREPGRRRKKIAEALRAANDIAQNYFNNDGGSGRNGSEEDGVGALSDASVVRSGNEEMILFPSYARRHVKSKVRQHTVEVMPGSNQSEQEFWRREWDKYQNEKAVAHVDVRGWIYTPHRGQYTRKQRLLIGIARQLVGLPGSRPSEALPPSQAPSRASSLTPAPTWQEEDLISFETEQLVKRGEAEAHNARLGKYSEDTRRGSDIDSLYSAHSRGPSPAGDSQHDITSSQNSGTQFSASPGIKSPRRHSSWSHPSNMSPEELAVAYSHLLARLKPFMVNPLIDSPVSAFFYNDEVSRQHTAYTDQNGHFSFHTPLEFVPTHVRILASEKLSITEEVHITSPKGISLISDIDDTIKHSGISEGAREIFRNAFVRHLDDMSIDGVREWYNALHNMGVKLHYVSNSPWQMYPVLATYFKMAGLPKGSFHLKQYSGALAGIFEPVAERKKSSLMKIFNDFPERKFILVGDSGEADLEVYTDVALDNPGRVLGIFIRDVTTTVRTGYFDPSTTPLGSSKHSSNHSRNKGGDTLAMSKRLSRPDDIRDDDADLKAAIAASLADMEEESRRARRGMNPDSPAKFDSVADRLPKPALPLRPHQRLGQSSPGAQRAASPHEEDLIDFSDELKQPEPLPTHQTLRSNSPQLLGINDAVKDHRPSPSPPPKPQALRSPSPGPPATRASEYPYKSPPPRPRKPSSVVRPPPQLPRADDIRSHVPSPLPSSQPQHQRPSSTQPIQPSPLSQVIPQSPTSTAERPPLPERPKSYQKISQAVGTVLHTQSSIGQIRPLSPSGSSAEASRLTSHASMGNLRSDLATSKTGPPPPPPRRSAGTLPSTDGRQTSSGPSGSRDDEILPDSPSEAGMSRKEWLWQQRLARARSVLEPRGVTLRTWRVGIDVSEVCIRLAEIEMKKIETEAKKS